MAGLGYLVSTCLERAPALTTQAGESIQPFPIPHTTGFRVDPLVPSDVLLPKTPDPRESGPDTLSSADAVDCWRTLTYGGFRVFREPSKSPTSQRSERVGR